MILTFHTVSDIFGLFDLCELCVVGHIVGYQIIITEMSSKEFYS